MAAVLPSDEEGRSLREAAVSFGVGVFSAYRDGDQTITAGGNVVVQFNTVDYNPDGWYDVANYKFLPKKAGYYLFTAFITGSANRTNQVILNLMVNGAIVKRLAGLSNAGRFMSGAGLVKLNGSTDYVQLGINPTTDNFTVSASASQAIVNMFQGVLISTKP